MYTIFIFLTTIAALASLCGDHCNSDVCIGKADEEITIPCGSYSENSKGTFTYRNESSTGNKSTVVLLDNSTECLVLNLTAYDDNTEISCEPSGAKGAKFIYDLSVHCKAIVCMFVCESKIACVYILVTFSQIHLEH